MKFGFRARVASIVGAAAFATLVAAVPSASAEPAPLPAPLRAPDHAPAAAPVAPGPVDATVEPLAGATVAVPEEIPHLASPENLPPGTSTTPTQQTRLGYLRDLWHAMQTQEVSGSDAILLLTQRPLSSDPWQGMPAGPQPPAPPAPAPETAHAPESAAAPGPVAP